MPETSRRPGSTPSVPEIPRSFDSVQSMWVFWEEKGKEFIANNKTTWRSLLRHAYPDDRGAEKRLYRLSRCMAHIQGKINADLECSVHDESSSMDHWIHLYNNNLERNNKLSLSGFEQMIKKDQEARRQATAEEEARVREEEARRRRAQNNPSASAAPN